MGPHGKTLGLQQTAPPRVGTGVFGSKRYWSAAPDGSLKGRVTLTQPASFWANSRAGNFEDYVMTDVWGFLMGSFPVLPEREAHALGAARQRAVVGGCSQKEISMYRQRRPAVLARIVSGIPGCARRSPPRSRASRDGRASE